MNCKHPIRIRNKNPNISELIKQGGHPVAFLEVPCGKCSACLANKQRDLEARCFLALEQYPFSVFGTWTFASEPHSFQEAFNTFALFRDRMRKQKAPFYYLVTVEECPSSGRIHLHSLNFSKSQITYGKYRENWKAGFCFLEPVCYGNVRYVCKYVTKDVLRPDAGRRFRMSPGLGLDVVRRTYPGFQGATEEKLPCRRIPRLFPRLSPSSYRLPRNFVGLVRPEFWYDNVSLLRKDVADAFGYSQPVEQKDALTNRSYYYYPKK